MVKIINVCTYRVPLSDSLAHISNYLRFIVNCEKLKNALKDNDGRHTRIERFDYTEI